jgi:drug/metabolite transporter (DMT)-like permease
MRLKASLMLVLVTACWAVSFPIMKALTLTQQEILSSRSSWFVAALCVFYRFGAAALITLAWSAPTIRRVTRLELQQGIGLGLFGSAGILLQMDGLAYTSASTSAFLTQCYCIFIPAWLAIAERKRPSLAAWSSCLLVISGVAILSGIKWGAFRLGRGELETILASVMFTGQILWLQQPRFSQNHVAHFSTIMFAVTALCCLPVALLSSKDSRDWFQAYASGANFGFLAVLVLVCTMGGYVLMNRWQRHVPATQAGVIYCAEPVFASVSALFLPQWFSDLAKINYANERLTFNLLLGGGLITVANLVLQLRPERDGQSA